MNLCTRIAKGLLPVAIIGLAGSSASGASCEPRWSTRAALPSTRASMGAASIGGTVYVVGGYISSATGECDAYDPSTDSWKRMATMPTARYGLAVVAVGGTLYAIGGTNGSVYHSIVEAYDTATNSWVTKASMSTPRTGLAAVAVGGLIYAIGGYNFPAGALKAVECYDPATNSWSARNPLQTAREHFVAVASPGGTIYAVGGYDSGVNYAGVEAFTPSNNTWSLRGDLPAPMYTHAGASSGGNMYVFGGQSNGSLLSTVLAYDPVADVWSPAANMSLARSDLAAAAVGGTIFAIGGYNGGFISTVEMGTPGACLSASASNTPGPSSVGQWMRLGLTVTNSGHVTANAVSPSLQLNSGSGLLSFQGGPLPAGPVDLAPMTSTTFVWTYSVSGAGIVGLTMTGAGTDGLSGAPAIGSVTRSFPMLAAASLTASIIITPSPAPVGQPLQVRVTVANPGGVPAAGVVPDLQINAGGGLLIPVSGPVPATAPVVQPGSATVFVWTYSVTSTGSVSFTATVDGVDSGTGHALSAGGTAVVVTAVPANPVASLVIIPATGCSGASLSLHMTVSNTGGKNITLGLAGMGIGYPATVLYYSSGPAPCCSTTIPAGGAVTFVWGYSVGAPGPAPFIGSFSGTDAFFGTSVNCSAAANGSYGTSASLAATSSGVNRASVGQAFSAILAATNSGDAPASSVSGTLTVNSGASFATLQSGPSPAGPVTINGNAVQQFTWTLSATAAGTLRLTMTGTGTDSCGGGPLIAAVSSQILVQTPAAFSGTLIAATSSVRQGQTIALTMTVTNTGQADALIMAPDARSLPPVAALAPGPLPSGPGALTGGTVRGFMWNFEAVVSGVLAITATLTGSDANAGWPVTYQATTAPIQVLPAAVLKSSLSLGSLTARVGDLVEARMTVTNTGDHDATGVQESLTFADPSAAEIVAGPSTAGPYLIVSGTARTEVWTVRMKRSGSIGISVQAIGADAVDATPVVSLSSGSVTVSRRFGEEALVMYPNPVLGDRVTIALKLEQPAERVEIEVYNAGLGRVFQGTWHNVQAWDQEFVITGVMAWAPGPYLVKPRATYISGALSAFPVGKLLIKR